MASNVQLMTTLYSNTTSITADPLLNVQRNVLLNTSNDGQQCSADDNALLKHNLNSRRSSVKRTEKRTVKRTEKRQTQAMMASNVQLMTTLYSNTTSITADPLLNVQRNVLLNTSNDGHQCSADDNALLKHNLNNRRSSVKRTEKRTVKHKQRWPAMFS